MEMDLWECTEFGDRQSGDVTRGQNNVFSCPECKTVKHTDVRLQVVCKGTYSRLKRGKPQRAD